ALRGAIGVEDALGVVAESSASGANPESPGRVRVEGGDEVALQLRRVLAVEGVEGHAVEADQSLLSPEPEIPILRLGDGEDRVLGEALFTGPAPLHVLVERL